jgi:hypothetical protein
VTPQTRWQHSSHAPTTLPIVPEPTPFIPDVDTFLTVIGRGLKQHASKFPSWQALFTLSSDQMRELGVEPPRSRKYLIKWRQRFRQGKFGAGGDMKHVQDGVGLLKVLELQHNPSRKRRFAVNVRPGEEPETMDVDDLKTVEGVHVMGAHTITGPYVQAMRGGGAKLAVTEGMWEDRRGHKVDGGERRRAEVRYKRNVAERKAIKEKQGFY